MALIGLGFSHGSFTRSILSTSALASASVPPGAKVRFSSRDSRWVNNQIATIQRKQNRPTTNTRSAIILVLLEGTLAIGSAGIPAWEDFVSSWVGSAIEKPISTHKRTTRGTEIQHFQQILPTHEDRSTTSHDHSHDSIQARRHSSLPLHGSCAAT